MPPNIDKFILCLEKYNFLQVFNKWETYLWSNFPYNYTWDVDIMFIGEPTEELGEKIIDFKEFCKIESEIKIDEQVFEDTKVFSHIEEYNRTGDMNLSNIVKYKTKKINSPRIYKSEPKQINKYFWKFDLIGVNEKYKFRAGKANLHYPILMEDFIKLVFNIKNQDIYNTAEDSSFKKYSKLNEEWRKKRNANR